MTREAKAWIDGFIGVVIFSASLPATRLAVGGFDPLFLTFARAAIAGLLALAMLLTLRQPMPHRADLGSLLTVAGCVVIGFPLFTALALRLVTSAHSIVFIGLLPMATAIFAVLRNGERPALPFWIFGALGSLSVASFALRGGIEVSPRGDLLMLAAVLVCGLGYAEGARLTARLGGWQVISWALVLALPFTVPLAWLDRPPSLGDVPASAWAGLAYVALFSMLIGFVFWYRGLAAGGAAAVGQLQLLQPLMGLTLAAVLLGERVDPAMIAVTLAVVGCVFAAKRFARPPVQSRVSFR